MEHQEYAIAQNIYDNLLQAREELNKLDRKIQPTLYALKEQEILRCKQDVLEKVVKPLAHDIDKNEDKYYPKFFKEISGNFSPQEMLFMRSCYMIGLSETVTFNPELLDKALGKDQEKSLEEINKSLQHDMDALKNNIEKNMRVLTKKLKIDKNEIIKDEIFFGNLNNPEVKKGFQACFDLKNLNKIPAADQDKLFQSYCKSPEMVGPLLKTLCDGKHGKLSSKTFMEKVKTAAEAVGKAGQDGVNIVKDQLSELIKNAMKSTGRIFKTPKFDVASFTRPLAQIVGLHELAKLTPPTKQDFKAENPLPTPEALKEMPQENKERLIRPPMLSGKSSDPLERAVDAYLMEGKPPLMLSQYGMLNRKKLTEFNKNNKYTNGQADVKERFEKLFNEVAKNKLQSGKPAGLFSVGLANQTNTPRHR